MSLLQNLEELDFRERIKVNHDKFLNSFIPYCIRSFFAAVHVFLCEIIICRLILYIAILYLQNFLCVQLSQFGCKMN